MKKLINKIKNWFKSLFSSRTAELNYKTNRIMSLERELNDTNTQINQLMGLLEDRASMVKNLVEAVEQKNQIINNLKQRERDLLDVIYEDQVNEMMRGADNDRN